MFLREAGELDFSDDRGDVIRNGSYLDGVCRRIPDDIFGGVVGVSGLPHTADVDDVLFFRLQSGQADGKVFMGKLIFLVSNNFQDMGVTDKTASFFHSLERLLDEIVGHLENVNQRGVRWKSVNKAAAVGFDWDKIEPVWQKVKEEFAELEDAWKSGDEIHTEEELGDLLFAIVNLSRFMKTEPEQALRKACEKFERRFKKVEEIFKARDQKMNELPLAVLDKVWDEVKAAE